MNHFWRLAEITVSVSVAVSVLANNAHHASAHGGVSTNDLSDILLILLKMILVSCLK